MNKKMACKACKLCPYRMVYEWAMLPKKARDLVMSFVEYLNERREHGKE